MTRKKFSSEAKYREATSSKKYRELVRRSGVPAPEPVVTLRRSAATGVNLDWAVTLTELTSTQTWPRLKTPMASALTPVPIQHPNRNPKTLTLTLTGCYFRRLIANACRNNVTLCRI